MIKPPMIECFQLRPPYDWRVSNPVFYELHTSPATGKIRADQVMPCVFRRLLFWTGFTGGGKNFGRHEAPSQNQYGLRGHKPHWEPQPLAHC